MLSPRALFQPLSFCFALAIAVILGPQLAAGKTTPDEATSGGSDMTVLLRGDESPDVIQKMVYAVGKSGKSVTIRVGAPEPAKADKVATSSVPPPTSVFDLVITNVINGFDASNRALPAVTKLADDMQRAWHDNSNGQSGPPASLRLFGVLIASFLAGFFAVLSTRRWVSHHHIPRDPSLSQRFFASLAMLYGDIITLLAVLAAMRVSLHYILPEHDLAREIAHRANIVAMVAGNYILGARFILAPNDAPRRLLPLPHSDFHYKMLLGYGIAGPVALGAVEALATIATQRDSVLGVFNIASTLLTLYKIAWFWLGRHDFRQLVLAGAGTPERPNILRRGIAFATPYLLILGAMGIWAIARAGAVMDDGDAWGHAAGLTQWMIIILPICASGIGPLVASLYRDRRPADHMMSPLLEAAGESLRSLASGLVWILGIILLIWVWGNLFVDMNTSLQNDTIRQAITVVTMAFTGWVAWRFLTNFFAAIAPSPLVAQPAVTGEDDTSHAAYVPSRLATILPVVRGVVLGGVVALTLLVCLSKLGVDISPLIAGFGIMGLAVSFGSQTLVKDIVSGFFFMLEDAFRIGEYVDTGKLKGTVEKISLRSVQLRHQSGLVHVVPFGQLSSITNASRDWATVKFNLRLDHSADIEKARKTIKKIGAAMLADPELGNEIIAPLKLQGVNEISDNAIIVRLKFTAKPDFASQIQRVALRKVRDGLIAAGVPFASNQVTVRASDNPNAAAAYAHEAAPTFAAQ